MYWNLNNISDDLNFEHHRYDELTRLMRSGNDSLAEVVSKITATDTIVTWYIKRNDRWIIIK
jgi:hypothetical protein